MKLFIVVFFLLGFQSVCKFFEDILIWFDGTGNGIDLEWKVFRGDKNYKS